MRTYHADGKAKQFTESIFLALIPRNSEREPEETPRISIYEHTTKKYDLQSTNRIEHDANGDSQSRPRFSRRLFEITKPLALR